LVVIAIIGVLVAMLLPAIQAAREAARRTQCQNNMQECGTAILDYANAKGFLPASRTADGNLNVVFNWVYPILPQLEQTTIHRQIRMNGAVPTDPIRIPILMCPSQGEANFSEPAGLPGFPLSYIVNGGRANSPANFDYLANGLFVDKGTIPHPPGPTQHKIEEISGADGASTTLMLSETMNAQCWLVAPLQQHSQMLWFPEDPQTFAGFIGLNQDEKATVADVDSDIRYARPSSGHPNGFNVLMADNSVRFMQDTVDYRIYAVLMTSNGRKAADPNLDMASQPTVPNPIWQHPPGNPPAEPYPGTDFD
jgi:prepilin-type processing-associated H-X9-DG protein